MGKSIIRATVFAMLMLASACTATQSAHRAGVSYNRAFANARNEVLLLNILRAAAREPMQFSTINSATGAPREGAQITIPFNNIIFGGDEAINPSIGLTARNPSITISPLDGREFRQGLATPVPIGLVDELTGQGWDRATALQLTLGGVVCREKQPEIVRLNLGDDELLSRNFDLVLADSGNFTVLQQKGGTVTTLRLNSNELAGLLRQGVGEGRQVGTITRIDAASGTTFDVQIIESASARVDGLNFMRERPEERVCGGVQLEPGASVQVLTRSPQSMIFYLAELHRRQLAEEIANCRSDRRPPALFRIRVACDNMPAPRTSAVSAEYRGRRYYISSDAEGPEGDATLRVFSLLTELIALQTTAANLQANRPILTIPQ